MPYLLPAPTQSGSCSQGNSLEVIIISSTMWDMVW